jgi:hypothetical protein
VNPSCPSPSGSWLRAIQRSWLSRTGSFFDDELPPQFPGPVPCPQTTCVCLDRCSFLAGQERNCTTDPLAMYRDALLELAARARRAGKKEGERFVGAVAGECGSQRLDAAGEVGS